MTRHLCDSEFPWCPADAHSGDFYKLRVKDLSPTQFAVGKAEVAVRAGRMRKKYRKDPGRLHDYLRVRPVPVVVRGTSFYLVDHHHLVRALYDILHEKHGKDICVYVKVIANASTLEEVYFWKTMHAQHRVYLFDHGG
ncbi:MAG: ParB-like protein, partial [Gammaproteobacteria bacterium]